MPYFCMTYNLLPDYLNSVLSSDYYLGNCTILVGIEAIIYVGHFLSKSDVMAILKKNLTRIIDDRYCMINNIAKNMFEGKHERNNER